MAPTAPSTTLVAVSLAVCSQPHLSLPVRFREGGSQTDLKQKAILWTKNSRNSSGGGS